MRRPLKFRRWGRSLLRIGPHLDLMVHPAVRRLDLAWNRARAVARTDGRRATSRARCAGAPHPWLLWRKELQIFFRPLTAFEAEALDAARQGRSFGGVCVALCAALDEEQAPGRAAAFLREWVESGMIVGMHAAKSRVLSIICSAVCVCVSWWSRTTTWSADAIARGLGLAGFAVDRAPSAEVAATALAAEHFDLAVVDIWTSRRGWPDFSCAACAAKARHSPSSS